MKTLFAFLSCLLATLTASTAAAEQTAYYPKLGVVRTTETYRKVGDVELNAHVFQIALPGHASTPIGRTAIVFFFGGGWKSGKTTQFQPHAQYFATRNAVAITPEYRIRNKHQSTAIQSVEDAKAAIRWVRQNAKRLGVDPNKIVAGGGSAGGHLAAAVATLPDDDETRKRSELRCVPNALLLFNPALDLRPSAFKITKDSERYQDILSRLGTTPEKISPVLHITKKAPPTIIFHGTDDPTVPFSQATNFAKAWSKHGVCQVEGYEGQAHGFFNLSRKNKYFRLTVEAADRFLVKHKFLNGSPTIKDKETAIRASQR
ncbi:MAG: hypothetical protein CMJ78_24045 [Planctomycetaceae bacterium]|nr:hypothetical protein [Planctomycetaceae bacterium]